MAEIPSKEFFIDVGLSSKERYDLAKFMEFMGDNHDPLTSSFLNNIQSLAQGGRYVVQGEDERPDWISYRIYGNTQYWWIVMLYNGKTEFNDVVTGEELNYPQLQALEDFYFSLKIKQNRQDKEA